MIDFSQQKWVQPVGTVALSCLIHQTRKENREFSFETHGCENLSYWERMGFFENFKGRIGSPFVKPSGDDRFSVVTSVGDIDYVDDITVNLVAVAIPSKDAKMIYSHVVSEALNNVCQHSGGYGYCASQFYPNDHNRVRFCIGDSGMGLFQSLSAFAPGDHSEAIHKALEVGVSGRSAAAQANEPRHMRNRGVGLSAIRKLVTANQGVVSIWSGDALHKISYNDHSVFKAPYWQGTLVSAFMPRNVVNTSFEIVMAELSAELKDRELSKRQ